MSDDATFGTLVDVEARTAWSHEAHGFTPWLAENLDRLGEAIGVRMELTERESGVGRFVADIVARTVIDDLVVVIENQLERSDHTHLGQIMTYLAGTEARTVVWVAPQFCEEHLSAIRWLNQHSHEEFSFFAVRLRVVRIGDSPLAPLFEVLEKPNAWDRTLQQETRANAEVSERAMTRRAFWARYGELYPYVADMKLYGGGSSTWIELSERRVVISRYKSKSGVGIFLRGLGKESLENRAARIEPFVDALEARLGVAPGPSRSFENLGPRVTDDPATWDPAIHWLEQVTECYKAAVEAIIPKDTA